MATVYRPKGSRVWYASFKEGGVWRDRSTRCTNQAAAIKVAEQYELEAADPTYHAAHQTSIVEVLSGYVDDLERRQRSPHTVAIALRCAGHIVRIIPAELPAAELTYDAIEDYFARRRSEGAHQHTLTKERAALKAALRLAWVKGQYPADKHPDRLFGPAWKRGYVPRKRWLTEAEALGLLLALSERRRAHVAYVLATGARWSESEAAQPGDVDTKRGVVLVRGTKTERAADEVPILPWVESMLVWSSQWLPFEAWGNHRRDILRACAKGGIEPVTANDLRRTAGHWLRQRVGDSSLVGRYLRHADSAMADRVYARSAGEELRATVLGLLR
jgi:integrase